MTKRSKWSLIGISDHQGVVNVGGRVGAALGPSAFRAQFKRLHGQIEVHRTCQDTGDVPGMTSALESNLKLAARFISKWQGDSQFTIVVGGGHDHGYSHLKGVLNSFSKAKFKLGCINIDAHLDVRKPAPLITSGSPFYLALEEGVLNPKNFIEFGIQAHCNRPELWKYVEAKNVTVIPFESCREGKAVALFKRCLTSLATRCDAIVISLDLDTFAEAHAPGVSAPQAEGFTPSQVLEMLEHAALQKKVCSLGIFELNPSHDVDQKTARLAATCAYHFALSKLRKSST